MDAHIVNLKVGLMVKIKRSNGKALLFPKRRNIVNAETNRPDSTTEGGEGCFAVLF